MLAIVNPTTFVGTLAATLCLCTTASATTYYISPAGLDSNTGTSTLTPWQTLTKVNNTPFHPGDRILFQGGQTFPGELEPSSSGTGPARITYSTYGAGKATIPGGEWTTHSFLTFANLSFQAGFQGGNTTAHANWITVRNCVIDFGAKASNDSQVGLNATGDAWVITGNTVQNIGNSGMLLEGDSYAIYSNTIHNVGLDLAIPYHSHGIYLRVSNAFVVGNTISSPSNSDISPRFHNSFIAGNFLSGGSFGISFFPYDHVAGHSYWANNTITGQSVTGIYVNGGSGGTTPTVESFSIFNNLIEPNAGPALSLDPILGSYNTYGNLP